jgi:hypothetical protein
MEDIIALIAQAKSKTKVLILRGTVRFISDPGLPLPAIG